MLGEKGVGDLICLPADRRGISGFGAPWAGNHVPIQDREKCGENVKEGPGGRI